MYDSISGKVGIENVPAVGFQKIDNRYAQYKTARIDFNVRTEVCALEG